MKAITLTQPWATLIAIGAKKIETRSWATKYRGPLAIHAAKTFGVWGESGIRQLLNQYPSFRNALSADGWTVETLPRSCVVATCNLIACLPIKQPYIFDMARGVHIQIPPEQPELDFGDYTPGRFAWILADVKPLPIAYSARGALGLWEWAGAA